MGERKGVNKYYPPDFDPSKGGLNAYHGTHALRERASKLNEGILIIRFEMPYNIWCNGCGNHIGMGVRYNAQKRKIGNYYTTPIYKFKMKCHLCDQYFEIRTDPKNCEYEILSGCRRKEERWDTEKAGNVQTTEREVKKKLMMNAMFKLEHQSIDEGKVKQIAPTLSHLEDICEKWHDDFAVNQMLRKKFRKKKKEILAKTEKDNELKKKMSLHPDFHLLDESEEDKRKAQRIIFNKINDTVQTDLKTEKNYIRKCLPNSSLNLAKSLAKAKSSSTLTKSLFSTQDYFGIQISKKTNVEGDGTNVKSLHDSDESYLRNDGMRTSESIHLMKELSAKSIPNRYDSTDNINSKGEFDTETCKEVSDSSNVSRSDYNTINSVSDNSIQENSQSCDGLRYQTSYSITNSDIRINAGTEKMNNRTSLVNYFLSDSSDENT